MEYAVSILSLWGPLLSVMRDSDQENDKTFCHQPCTSSLSAPQEGYYIIDNFVGQFGARAARTGPCVVTRDTS